MTSIIHHQKTSKTFVKHKIIITVAVIVLAAIIALSVALPLTLGKAENVNPYFLPFDQKSDYAITAEWKKIKNADNYTVEYCFGERTENNIIKIVTSNNYFAVPRQKGVLSLRVKANSSDAVFSEWIATDIAALKLPFPSVSIDNKANVTWTAVRYDYFGEKAEEVFKDVERILMIACGTSYYAALTSKYWLEAIAGIPCDVEIASEYRYRKSVPNPKTLVVTISQSGETADTLAALKHARDLGMTKTLTICNVPTSAMVRESLLRYITRAGVEIGVASTKAFTTQLTALFLLTICLAKVNGRLDSETEAEYMRVLRHVPKAVSAVLALEPQVIAWAERFASKQNALFLGRGIHYPIALEGALKLKEISYIHAEAYPAGELKHGPLALVDESIPVVTVAPNDELLEKLKSNMKEVEARKGELYVFADADTGLESSEHIHVIRMPENYGPLSPILHVVPLQLLAYHTACIRGNDVDKPRNLAKSVTTE